VQFVCVYIQEAHPQDGWQLAMNLEQEIVFHQPTNSNERASVAEACMLHLNFEMPMLLDDATDQVDEKYMALPERLFLIDARGDISWRSEIGPWGFDVAAWVAAIESLLASPA